MASSTITTKGQVTIPAEIRRSMGLKAGDRLEFIPGRETGRVEIRKKTGTFQDLAGIFKHDGPPLSIEQLDEAIGDYLVEDDERIKREWNEWKAQQR